MYQIIEEFGIPKRLYHKIWLIMRLTTVLLIACLMQVSAAGLAQRITLNQRNVPLNNVLKEIRKQSGFDFLSSWKGFPRDQKVTVVVNNATVEEALDEAFKGLDITYKIEGNKIAVKQKEEKGILERLSDYLARIDVQGTVIDDKGLPIAGATIKVKEGKGYAITDEKGNFTLRNLNEGELIVISFIGFNSKEVKAVKDLGKIKLDLATSKLDEVQVIAYGETSKRYSLGNVSTISANQIENKPIQNVLLALQGEVPGIVVGQVNGYANSGISIQIQGLNSMAQGNDPFYVVDGIPFDSQMPNLINRVGGLSAPLPGDQGTLNPGIGNPLNFINPQDIESVSVLKGADATAIYGSRAANGAILITTKKARAGEGKVDINVSEGFSRVPHFIEMMSREQYLQMRRDAYYGTDGLTNASSRFATQYDLNGVWDNTRYTDWQKVLAGGTARYSNYSTALSGGPLYDQYRLSANYVRQTTVFQTNNLSDQKISLHSSLTHSSLDRKFNLLFNASYQYDENKLPASDLAQAALRLSPVAPPLYNSNGTLNWAPNSSGISTWTNPMATLRQKAVTNTSNLISNLRISYQLAKSLELASSFAYNNLLVNEVRTNPTDSRPIEYNTIYGIKPSASFNNIKNNNWNIEPQLKYSHIIGRGKLDVLIASTFQSKSLNQLGLAVNNYPNDIQLEDPSAGTAGVSSKNISAYRYNALFGRLNYLWDSKYILNLTARRDGSSRFGENNMFSNFYSVGGGWIFTEEKIIKNSLPWLSFGKIHTSYGITGSDQIGDYQYLNLYTSDSYPVNYQQTSVLVAKDSSLPNPNLQWEENRKFDIGIDLGFLDDKIVISGTYFRNRSSNPLLFYNLPSITGAGGYYKNQNATVQNQGMEFTCTSTNIKTGNFKWLSSFNLTSVNNKLISFANVETSSYANDKIIGRPIGGRLIFEYAGIDPQTGLYLFRKADGSTTSDFNSLDRVKDGKAVDFITKFSGGMTQSLSYQNFDLTFLFSFAVKNAPGYSIGDTPGLLSSSGAGNQPAYLLDYWKAPGDIATYQKPSSISGVVNTNQFYALNYSTIGVGDASFIKLKNISFAYRLPPKLLKNLHIQNCSVFANAQNLYTLTNYKGIDPESLGGYLGLSLPPLRTIAFGLKLGL